jgi:hypothetical protein
MILHLIIQQSICSDTTTPNKILVLIQESARLLHCPKCNNLSDYNVPLLCYDTLAILLLWYHWHSHIPLRYPYWYSNLSNYYTLLDTATLSWATPDTTILLLRYLYWYSNLLWYYTTPNSAIFLLQLSRYSNSYYDNHIDTAICYAMLLLLLQQSSCKPSVCASW